MDTLGALSLVKRHSPECKSAPGTEGLRNTKGQRRRQRAIPDSSEILSDLQKKHRLAAVCLRQCTSAATLSKRGMEHQEGQDGGRVICPIRGTQAYKDRTKSAEDGYQCKEMGKIKNWIHWREDCEGKSGELEKAMEWD